MNIICLILNKIKFNYKDASLYLIFFFKNSLGKAKSISYLTEIESKYEDKTRQKTTSTNEFQPWVR